MSSTDDWNSFRSKHAFAAHFLVLPGAASVGVFGLVAGALAGLMLSAVPALVTKNDEVVNVVSSISALVSYLACSTFTAYHCGGPLSVVTWLSCNIGMVAFGIASKSRF